MTTANTPKSYNDLTPKTLVFQIGINPETARLVTYRVENQAQANMAAARIAAIAKREGLHVSRIGTWANAQEASSFSELIEMVGGAAEGK